MRNYGLIFSRKECLTGSVLSSEVISVFFFISCIVKGVVYMIGVGNLHETCPRTHKTMGVLQNVCNILNCFPILVIFLWVYFIVFYGFYYGFTVFLGSSADTCVTIGVCMSDSARVCVEH